MFCFALTLLLACSAPYSKAHADDLNLVRGVHIDTLATIISSENAGDSVIWHTSSTTLAASLAAGRVLLHRYGCITCHDLDIPLPAQPQVPQLDLIAHKTISHWLRRWLYQPSSYLPHSKMPRRQPHRPQTRSHRRKNKSALALCLSQSTSLSSTRHEFSQFPPSRSRRSISAHIPNTALLSFSHGRFPISPSHRYDPGPSRHRHGHAPILFLMPSN
jgi:hypothetical protein